MPLSKKDKQATEEKGSSLGKKFRGIFSSKDENHAGDTGGFLPGAYTAPQQSINQYPRPFGYHHQNLPAQYSPQPHQGQPLHYGPPYPPHQALSFQHGRPHPTGPPHQALPLNYRPLTPPLPPRGLSLHYGPPHSPPQALPLQYGPPLPPPPPPLNPPQDLPLQYGPPSHPRQGLLVVSPEALTQITLPLPSGYQNQRVHSPPSPYLVPAIGGSSGSHAPPMRSNSAFSSLSLQRQNEFEEADEELFRDRQYSPPLQRLPLERRAHVPHPEARPEIVVAQVPDEDSDEGNFNGTGTPPLVFLVPSNQAGLLSIGGERGGSDFRVATPSLFPSERRGRKLWLNNDFESSDESLFAAPNRYRPSPGSVSREKSPSRVNLDGEAFVPSTGNTPDGGGGGLNLNRRYEFLPESMVPFWYNKTPPVAPEESRSYLCETCRHIDILALFKQEESTKMPTPREYIALGTLEKLFAGKSCGLCGLIARIIGADTGVHLSKNLSDDARKEQQREKLLVILNEHESYYLCPIRFETTFNEPKLYVYSGKEMNDAANYSTIQRPRGSMAIRPISRMEPNLGRLLLKPDQIDFGWIRERMKLCDERDVGKLDYQHSFNVRAIDVWRMCIVDVNHGERYVTLSYVWGKAEQFLLTKNTEALYRGEEALQQAWEYIPKTIQDSIKLVREIGERFLWVDAICIVQDDPEDQQAQIAGMGQIYKNSILTICVCCGEDANYGIPGIGPGTRKTRQVAGIAGNIVIGNDIHNSEDRCHVKWDTRGWTLQEKVLSQRKLQIYDTCVTWWCWHTITGEDEHCRHVAWKPDTTHQSMFFFRSEHDLVMSKILKNSNMDTYAFIVADYTARNLTHQSDAESAVMGALLAIEGLFRGKFVAGMPDTEMSAALLWVPLGSSKRRIDSKTEKPMFPSWSWLGWEGHVAYPWLIERNIPMSEDGSPLLWENALPTYDNSDDENQDDLYWFTGDEYRMNGVVPNAMQRRRRIPDRWKLDDSDGWTHIDSQSPSHRWLHAVIESRDEFALIHTGSSPSLKRLRLRTLSAHFKLDSQVRARKEKHDYLHTLHQVRILNARGFAAGYIYTPDPATLSQEEMGLYTTSSDDLSPASETKEFIVLSRASTTSDPRIGEGILRQTPISELHDVYSMAHMAGALGRLHTAADGDAGEKSSDQHVDELGHFDIRLYDATTPWGLFNVMIIEREREQVPGDGRSSVAHRIAIGRIHVAAFMEAGPRWTQIALE
jgi:Heterokaryon incompatibility protein (HET)